MNKNKFLKEILQKGFFKGVFLTVFLGYFIFITTDIVNSSPYEKKDSHKEFKNEPELDKIVKGKAKVIDGDSLYVNNNEIRLLDIDAPEYRQTCFDDNNNSYKCGVESANFLRELIEGKDISCYYSQKDIYYRILARCFLGNDSINEKIISSGMAVIYDLSKANQTIINLENRAKINKLGIWRGYFQLPKEYRRSEK